MAMRTCALLLILVLQATTAWADDLMLWLTPREDGSAKVSLTLFNSTDKDLSVNLRFAPGAELSYHVVGESGEVVHSSTFTQPAPLTAKDAVVLKGDRVFTFEDDLRELYDLKRGVYKVTAFYSPINATDSGISDEFVRSNTIEIEVR